MSCLCTEGETGYTHTGCPAAVLMSIAEENYDLLIKTGSPYLHYHRTTKSH